MNKQIICFALVVLTGFLKAQTPTQQRITSNGFAGLVGDYRTRHGANITILPVELGIAFFNFETGRFGILHKDSTKLATWFAGPGAIGESPKEIEIEFDAHRPSLPELTYRDLKRNRTETARRVLPYRKTNVGITHGGFTLQATISYPTGKGPYPAIVLVHGGGPGPRSALEIWSNMYNRLGFACLTFDKREKGSGPSEGPFWQTFEDLATDALACIDNLRGNPEIIKKRIGMAAFSQGGWVSEIACGRDSAVSFLVMISCPVISPAERDLESTGMRLLVDGYSQADIEDAADFNGFYEKYGRGAIGWNTYKEQLDKVKNKNWFSYVEYTDSPIGADNVFYKSQYGRYYGPQNDLRKLRIPVLAIYGQNDKTVPPLRNSQLAMQYLSSSHQKTVIVVVPKANHGLIESETGSGKELVNLNTYAKGYFELIKLWLRNLD